jgi:16S rRNA (adenine1518-N6/adenine1519-N6)-dimethyltransferase
MRLTEMRDLLARKGIQLTNSLGQNFLHDANQLRRIVDAAELEQSDKVMEIGPGLGPLTELLLEKSGEVLAIEKDARLVGVLRERFGGAARLRLLHDDALEYLQREPRDLSGWKMVSNLPYSVASPILVELASGNRAPRRIVATLQLEVAKRLMARAGDADYGVLTLLVQVDFEPRDWFRIPAGCFFPEPDVDSACVILDRRSMPLLRSDLRNAFVRIVKRAFSQRRKMMLKLLKQDWPAERLARAFRELDLGEKIRAEAISIEQFAALTRLLSEEIFDVVNDRDEVVDRRPRSEVHRLGLLHRAAHVLVFNSRGQVFLQKRSMEKDRQPGVWDSSASGHLDSGEDYDACAVREVREEIGLTLVGTPERLFKVYARPETDQEFVWAYRCEAEGPFELAADEIERGGWFAPDEVTRWLKERPEEFATAFALIWRKWTGREGE